MDIEHRIGKAWKAFWSQRKCCNELVDAALRIRALEVFIKPILLHASGSWTPMPDDLQHILSCHLQMCRIVLASKPKQGEPYHECIQRAAARTRKIWRALGIPPWNEAVLSSNHRWAGHVARHQAYDPTRWSFVMLCWRDSAHINWQRLRSYDGRKLNRGHRRPPWRWDHHLYSFFASDRRDFTCKWRVVAQHEEQWKLREVAFVSYRLANSLRLHA